MNQRIKYLRKTLNLTQEKFGDRIGMKKNSLSQVESGKNAVTEQTLKSICREFNVNEEWLRSGTGEMFEELLPEDEYAKAAAEIAKNDPDGVELILAYHSLADEDKEVLKKFIFDCARRLSKEKE